MKLRRFASLPWILSIPVAVLGGVFTLLFGLLALIPDGIDGDMRMLAIIFYSFLLPFLLIAVPLMNLLLRKSKRHIVVFDYQSVSFADVRYELSLYQLIYYPIRWGNYLRYRPGMLTLRPQGWEGINAEAMPKEIEVGCFTKREVNELMKLGLRIERG